MRVAIDLTPLGSGKENDDAQALVITLLKSFSNLGSSKKPNLAGYSLDQKRYKFILITAPWNHHELSAFEDDHVTCILVKDLTITRSYLAKTENENFSVFKRFIRKAVRKILKKLENSIRALKFHSPRHHSLLGKINADILFAPFSETTYAESEVPLVATVYDLQHLDYPFFFSSQDSLSRTLNLQQLISQARRIVCVSDFTRQSLISHLQAAPELLTTIPICIQDRLPRLDDVSILAFLGQLKLEHKRYAFYPANYRPHKNHHLLLLAYSIYCGRLSKQPMDLVFTGVLPEAEQELRHIVERMHLQEHVHFFSYLSDEALTAVWQGSFCLLFPSLYEGFGIPLLDAMRYGKPVACSHVGSLPEVGGEAVLYFDPRNPEEIATCLARLEQDSDLVEQLVQKGYQQLSSYQQQDMLNQYLKCFEEAIRYK
jgi:glycosyltransferase involved in cell wall biosynthesis